MAKHSLPGPRTAHVGGNIKRQRERRGLTQVALAQKIGWTQQVIAKLELGRTGIRVEQLLALADALDVKASVFLRGAQEIPPT